MEEPRMSIEDFGIDLNRLLTPPNHVWVGSGRTTVRALENTVAGVSDFVSPPFATSGFSALCRFIVEGASELWDRGSLRKGDAGILYSGGTWYPHEILRRGTYHHLKEAGLLSFGVGSSLVPLAGGAGFTLEVRLTNRSGRSVRVAFRPELKVERLIVLPLSEWGFSQPKGGKEPREGQGGRSWVTTEAELVASYDDSAEDVPAGGTTCRFLTVRMAAAGAAAGRVEDPAECAAESRRVWAKRIDSAYESLPRVESDIPGLQTYYDRSVLSGLVCVWDNPQFSVNPFFATSGMDGGAICCYLWDLAGYIPNTAALVFGKALLPTMEAMSRLGLDKYYAVTPAGTGVGVSYSYSVWCFVSLVSAMARFHGPSRELYEAAKRFVLFYEAKASADTGLIDYGTQENLLEMRGAGWEHVTASPNAERATCLRRLADLGELFGEPETAAWRAKADGILEAVRKLLWNEKEGWFDCLYPGGRRETILSTQVFDALRAGAATEPMKRAILAKLVGSGFLGDYGLSSVASADAVHYEVNDPDWSGSGSYTGEAPQLAQILFELDEARLGWEVLGRLYWMGRHLAYYPQEHYCDRPALPAHKRANVIAGMCGAEAILFGAFGLDPSLDGSCAMTPRAAPAGSVSLRGLRLRGRTIDARMEPDRFRLRVDGRDVYDGPLARVQLWGPGNGGSRH